MSQAPGTLNLQREEAWDRNTMSLCLLQPFQIGELGISLSLMKSPADPMTFLLPVNW